MLQKEISKFGELSPFSLVEVRFVYDPTSVLQKNYSTRIPIGNFGKQVRTALKTMRNVYGSDLLYFGIAGSSNRLDTNSNSDIDVCCVVDELGSERAVTPTDMKVFSLEQMQKYLESGDPFVTNVFTKSRPLFATQRALDLRKTKPKVHITIPYLRRKSRFDFQSSDIYHSAAKKYHAAALSMLGNDDAAFGLLDGIETEDIENLRDKTPQHYRITAYYLREAVRKLFTSLVNLEEALHVKEEGEVADLKPLFKFVGEKSKETGDFSKQLHKVKKDLSYENHSIGEKGYTELRTNTRKHNSTIEGML